MKKLISALLVFVMLCSLAVPALAYSDATFTKNTTLTSFINRYDNVTVKAGVTLTMKEFKPDPQGLEIYKSLTVEDGGKIVGPGTIILCGNVSYSGMDFYYRVGGKEKLLDPANLHFFIEEDENHWCVFEWVSGTGHYVKTGEGFEADPFDIPQSGGGENGGGSQPDARAQQIAEGLKELGLFVGSDAGFELDRAPTRVEEVIMLIRLLGKEEEALSGTWHHPFTDVPTWPGADNYIGYAYEHDLVGGVADDKFGTDTPATIQMFATFVLRAMGYTDDTRGGTDFTYAGAVEFAMQRGIVAGEADISGFNRGTCVKMMESALHQSMKTGEPLWQKLAGEGVFTEADYKKVFG